MGPQRQHTWLSQASREAQRQAAGQTSLLSRLRARRRIPSNLLQSGGLGSTSLVLVVLIVLHVTFLVFLRFGACRMPTTAGTFFCSRQVSAAVIGIAFVLLILIVGTIHRSVQRVCLERFVPSSGLFSTTVFLLGTIFAIGLGSLWLLPSAGSDLPLPFRQKTACVPLQRVSEVDRDRQMRPVLQTFLAQGQEVGDTGDPGPTTGCTSMPTTLAACTG